jgi:hypothetical protein
MFKVNDDRTIEITMGDSGYFAVAMRSDISGVKGNLMLDAGDEVVFTVKISEYDTDPVIRKVLTKNDQTASGKITVMLNPADTANLEYMTYKYDMQATIHTDGRVIVDTFVPPTDFIVGKEVSF